LTLTITTTPLSRPALYPNPASGNTIDLYIPYSGHVDVVVYTLAFRGVIHQSLDRATPGETLPISLSDDWGMPLSDGLYYVVVKSTGNRWVGKLLVLR
jgi:hypothetical protein